MIITRNNFVIKKATSRVRNKMLQVFANVQVGNRAFTVLQFGDYSVETKARHVMKSSEGIFSVDSWNSKRKNIFSI